MQVRRFLNIARKNKYIVYTEPYKLNIWGIRNENTQANNFDDWIVCFWKDDKGNWQLKRFNASTDPGTFFLLNPLDNLGTAILKQGQYLNTYQAQYNSRLGFKALELVQIENASIIRDYDRNAVLDFDNGRITVGKYGINIHSGASPNGKSIAVDKWSAGCQVFGVWAEFAEFTALCEKHISLHGNIFSYTLIDRRAEQRAKRRMFLGTLVIIVLVGVLICYYRKELLGFMSSLLKPK